MIRLRVHPECHLAERAGSRRAALPGAHAQLALGISGTLAARPVQAAPAPAAAFTSGAALPGTVA